VLANLAQRVTRGAIRAKSASWPTGATGSINYGPFVQVMSLKTLALAHPASVDQRGSSPATHPLELMPSIDEVAARSNLLAATASAGVFATLGWGTL
jgi:hypothetical protein